MRDTSLIPDLRTGNGREGDLSPTGASSGAPRGMCIGHVSPDLLSAARCAGAGGGSDSHRCGARRLELLTDDDEFRKADGRPGSSGRAAPGRALLVHRPSDRRRAAPSRRARGPAHARIAPCPLPRGAAARPASLCDSSSSIIDQAAAPRIDANPIPSCTSASGPPINDSGERTRCTSPGAAGKSARGESGDLLSPSLS